MKADNELLEYMKRRYEFALKGIEDNEPHSDDALSTTGINRKRQPSKN